MTNRTRKRRPLRTAVRLLLLILAAALLIFWDNTALQVTHADAAFPTLPAGFDNCRIVVLGDLHTASFGEDNVHLLETVAEQAPEYIFLVGDLVDAGREVPPGYLAAVASGLSAIAPTYYVTGNHEWLWDMCLK